MSSTNRPYTPKDTNERIASLTIAIATLTSRIADEVSESKKLLMQSRLRSTKIELETFKAYKDGAYWPVAQAIAASKMEGEK